jgi:glycosyltransferase involved in cell wall biosynthesis
MITGSYPSMPCGVGDYTAQLVAALTASDKQVHVDIVTSTDDRILVPEGNGHGMHQVRGWGIHQVHHLLRLLESLDPDLIHIQYPAIGYGFDISPNILPLLCRITRLRAPVLVTVHDYSISHPLRRLSIIPLVLFSDRIIVCDPKEFMVLRRLFPFRKNRIIEIPLSSNIPIRFGHVPRKDSNEIFLAYFGFISRHKDVALLLRSLQSLRLDGMPVHLRLLGGISPRSQSEIAAFAKTMGVQEHLTFTGFLEGEEISRCLADSDIGLLPFRDGVSLRRASLITMMQHGLPVVTTRASDYLPDGLVDGVNIMLAAVDDREAFTAAISKLALDIGLRERLSIEGLSWASQFGWKRSASAHLEVYNHLVG